MLFGYARSLGSRVGKKQQRSGQGFLDRDQNLSLGFCTQLLSFLDKNVKTSEQQNARFPGP
jgi:hypothetical protein